MVRRSDTIAPVFEECAQLRLCRLKGDAVFQSRNDVYDVDPALPSRTRVEPEGQPNLGVVIHDVGPGRHNANDFVAAALDFHLLSNERSSSKCCSPQFVRENCDWWRQRPGPTRGFFVTEEPSLLRLNTERLEQVYIDRDRAHTKRSIPGRDVDLAGC